jgi:hypothetical protein
VPKSAISTALHISAPLKGQTPEQIANDVADRRVHSEPYRELGEVGSLFFGHGQAGRVQYEARIPVCNFCGADLCNLNRKEKQ